METGDAGDAMALGEKHMSGRLIGIGVGPGDPELLTLKGLRLIRGAPVIAYPAPDDGRSFARAIVAEHLDDSQLEYPIVIPMRAERYPAKEIYDAAAADLANHLRAGADVVVLCEGDPFFYGSFMYLHERLSGEFACEIVPGVSSPMACAAALGRPLAARNDVLTVIPGPLDDARMEALIAGAEAIAIMKVGRHMARLRVLIGRLGLTANAGYVERAGLENQKVLPLEQAGDDAPYFSMILIYKGFEDWTLTTGKPA